MSHGNLVSFSLLMHEKKWDDETSDTGTNNIKLDYCYEKATAFDIKGQFRAKRWNTLYFSTPFFKEFATKIAKIYIIAPL